MNLGKLYDFKMDLVSRRRTFVFICAVVSIVTLFVFRKKLVYRETVRFIPSYQSERHLLVDGVGCTIPDLDAFDPSIKHLISTGKKLKCETKPGLTYQRVNTVFVNETVLNTRYKKGFFNHCESDAVVRVYDNSDSHFRFIPYNVTFRRFLNLTSEFTRIRCYTNEQKAFFYNFYARNIPKPMAERRYRKYFPKHVRKNAVRKTYNVLLMGIDSVSRLNFIRHLPETREFLLSKLGAVDMTGYNKVADNTFVNLVPLLGGKYVPELPFHDRKDKSKPFDKYDLIFKRYSKAGYRTLMVEDDPYIATFNYLKEGFWGKPADDYIRPLAIAMEKEDSIWWSDHHCVHERGENDIDLDYIYRFIKANALKRRPYFGFSFLTRITHYWMNNAALAEAYHIKFLRRLHSSRLLNDTVMFYFSDHGMRYGEIRNTYIGKMSARLPAMYIYVPPDFRREYPKLYQNLLTNSHRLTTPFDIYETLLDLLNFNASVGSSATTKRRGLSLFSEIPTNRTCRDAGIPIHWCACGSQKVVPVNDSLVILSAKFLVERINKVINTSATVCSELKLGRVVKAASITPNVDMLTYQEEKIENVAEFQKKIFVTHYYQVTVETDPGSGRFEGTVVYHLKEKSLKLTGDLSRTNIYGETSWCVNNTHLKKFCYCKVQPR